MPTRACVCAHVHTDVRGWQTQNLKRQFQTEKHAVNKTTTRENITAGRWERERMLFIWVSQEKPPQEMTLEQKPQWSKRGCRHPGEEQPKYVPSCSSRIGLFATPWTVAHHPISWLENGHSLLTGLPAFIFAPYILVSPQPPRCLLSLNHTISCSCL